MVDRKRPPLSIAPHQADLVATATAWARTVSAALVIADGDEVGQEALYRTFPAIGDFVTDVTDRGQWRAYMLAVCRRAVEVLEGGAT